MKSSHILLSFFILFAGNLAAQNISYKVLEDNPDKIYSGFASVGIGMVFTKQYNALPLAINGRYDIGIVQLEGAVNYDLYKLEGDGTTFLTEIGAFRAFSNSSKTTEVKVITDYDPYSEFNAATGERTETTSFFLAPANVDIQRGGRAGLFFQRSGAEGQGFSGSTFFDNGGIYVGFQQVAKAYINTLVNNKDKRSASSFSKWYLDVMLLPISSVADETLNIETSNDGIIGWRAGIQLFGNAHEGANGFFRKMIYSADIGTRPLTGFNMVFTATYPLLSFK